MKGVSLIFEQVLLFMMGVTIFISCFSVFTLYQNYFLKLTGEAQAENVLNYISSHIIRIAQYDNETNVTLTLHIPKRIGNEGYEVILTNTGLNLTCLTSGYSISSRLYGLNHTFNLSGRIRSIDGTFIIYKKGNEIIII